MKHRAIALRIATIALDRLRGGVVVLVVAAVAVPCAAAARVCVCMCVCGPFLHRAREATRDRATHGIVCAISTARRVAVAVVAAAVVPCVAVARACVRVCVPRSGP